MMAELNERKQTASEVVRELPTAIIRWYPFPKKSRIAYVGKADAIFKALKEGYSDNVDRLPLSTKLSKAGTYDYIVCIAYAEKLPDINTFLKAAADHLEPTGKLILGMNNRLGLRYFCGDTDPHTGQVLDGLDDYFRAYSKEEDTFRGRSYDKAGLKKALGEAGFANSKFYSVMPGLENPNLIVADGYKPNESIFNRIFPSYNTPDSLFLEEERLYKGLMDNGMFEAMANAFFIEASVKAPLSDALQITNSIDRGKENAIITVIHADKTVTKLPAYEEGKWKAKALLTNSKKLLKRGIHVVEGSNRNGIYTMPYIDAPTGQIYLEQLLRTDKKAFIAKMDEFRDLLYASSEIYEGYYRENPPEKETSKQKRNRIAREKRDWEGQKVAMLKEGMIDMVPLNSLYVDGHFEFFDQEFCIPDLPADVLVSRMIFTFFFGNPEMTKLMKPEELYKRYNLPDPATTEGGNKYLNIEFRFFDRLMNRDRLVDYYKKIRRNPIAVAANRQRMNFSDEDYQRIFVDIFDKADERKLILFGSGLYARRFLALYGNDYPVYAAVDNNENRWGQKLYPEGVIQSDHDSSDAGISITSPEILSSFHNGEYKVLICIKNYLSVMNQLRQLGINEFSIYDPSKAYQRKRNPVSVASLEALEHSTVPEGTKKYHVGYIAGVFDLYHVGHLNMFRRAKELCDYLIVGVVSDEGVRTFKGVEPFVPFDERVEMIKSCRYVDEVVEIPYIFSGTEDAWRMHHFDVQFSGTDYVNDPDFARFKEFLEQHGATLEFFPYTQSTSSTKIKELIDRKLL